MANSTSTKWKDPYEEKLKNYLQQIEKREPFSFDINKDAMYQQLRDNYDQQGKLAMENTMGQAAAMTGGYGNSYAQTVGQQVYMQSMNELNNMVPTIQSMAQDRYDQETNDLYTKYSLYKGLSDESYQKYLQGLGATSGKSGKTENTYVDFGDGAVEKFRKQAAKGSWSDARTAFKDMLRYNHNPLDAAGIALEGAQMGGVAITKKEIQEIGDMLVEKGVSEDEVHNWETYWIETLKLASKNPLPQPNYGSRVPGGSGLHNVALK
jgi:hypothetical protein